MRTRIFILVWDDVSNEQKKELQKLQKQFSKLESELNDLNVQKATIETDLSKPGNYGDKNKFQQLENNYKNVQSKINTAEKEYEILFEKIMAIEALNG